MIIDCHGHYTTAPSQLQAYRDGQTAALKGGVGNELGAISDDEIRASLEGAQLKLQRERGTDLTIFSPRASAMGRGIRMSKLGGDFSALDRVASGFARSIPPG